MSERFEEKEIPSWSGPEEIKTRCSLIIPFGSTSYIPRLKNLLVSIRNQRNFDQSCVEIVLSYISNKQEACQDLIDLASRFGANLCRRKKEYKRFPLCYARNAGARAASSDLLIFVDADMMLDPESLCRTALKVPDSLVSIWTANVKDKISPGVDVRRVAASGDVLHAGYGGYLATRKSVFLRIGGYDEKYDIAWGAEDADLVDRLVEYGQDFRMALVNLSHTEGLLNLHTHHARVQPWPDPKTGENRRRYDSAKDIVCARSPEKSYRLVSLNNESPHSAVTSSSARLKYEEEAILHAPVARGFANVQELAAPDLTPAVSVVVCANDDKYVGMLHNCLMSIRRQKKINQRSLDIVVVSCEHRSKTEQDTNIAKVAGMYDARFIRYAKNDAGYNYALARNIGAKNARNDVLCFVDVDMVLDTDLVFSCLHRMKHGTVLTVLAGYLQKQNADDIKYVSDTSRFRSIASKLKRYSPGLGGCVFVTRSVFAAVNGYDEKFAGYGGPDIDFIHRLKKFGLRHINMTDKENLRMLHQWHPPRDVAERNSGNSAQLAKNQERLGRTSSGDLGVFRNRSGSAGSKRAVTIMIAHHHLRPVKLLERVLQAITKSTSLPTTVDLIVQGVCPLPDLTKIDLDVRVVQFRENKGMSKAREVSINKAVKRHHAYWAMVDDNSILPENGIDEMVRVLDYENTVGDHLVGMVQMSNDRAAKNAPVGIAFTDVTEGIPTMSFRRSVVAYRRLGDIQWCVGDLAGSGHSVYSMEAIESGAFPDRAYFVGLVDFDMGMAMHGKGYLSALLTSSVCHKPRDGCYPLEYRRIRHDRLAETYAIFSEKWKVRIRA